MASSVNSLVFQIVADARGGLAALGQVQQAARGVRTEVDGLDESFRQLGGSGLFVKHQLANSLESVQTTAGGAGAKLAEAAGGAQAFGKSSSYAQQTAFALANTIQDASTAGGDFNLLLRATGNNLIQGGQLLAYMAAEAKTTGATLVSSLGGALAGPAGIVAGMAAVIAIAPVVAQAIDDMFTTASERAEEARDKADEAFKALVQFDGDFDVSVNIGTVEEAGQALINLAAEQANIQAQLRDFTVGTTLISNRATGELETKTSAAGQAILRQVQQLQDRATELDQFITLTDDRLFKLREDQSFLSAIDPGGRIAAAREAEATAEKEAARARKEAGRQAAREQKEADREAARLAKEAADEAERRAGEARRERVRLEREQVQLTQQLRLSLIEEGQARELEVVSRTLADRQTQIQTAETKGAVTAAEAQTARTLALEVAEADRAAIRARYRAQAFEAQQRQLDAEGELEDRRARLAGATEASILNARLARVRAAVRIGANQLDHESDAYRRLVDAVRSADLDIAESAKKRADDRIEETDRELKAALDAIDRVLVESGRLIDADTEKAERALKDRTQAWEDYARDALNIVEDAFTRRREFSEEEIGLERRDMAQKRRELEQDLRSRRLSQEDYETKRRQLAAESAEFEAAVAEDSASRVTAALGGVVLFARQAALDYIKQEIARAVASQIASVIKTIPFPLNLAVAGGAVAATYALQALIPGFDSGGYTGAGGKLQPAGIVHAGEFVFTKEATEGNVHLLYALMDALKRRVPISELLDSFPGYDVGGQVRALETRHLFANVRPSLAASRASGSSQIDLGGIERQFARIADEVVRMKQEPASVYADPKTFRRGQAAASADRSQTQPSRVRRITVTRR